jgi:hypothetical protein
MLNEPEPPGLLNKTLVCIKWVKKMNRVDELFDNLDQWRHLPSYQLERRADVFFSIYLPSILQSKLGIEIEGIIPEFPVRKGTIQTESGSNKSVKIDYLVKVKGTNDVLFVELKTDDSSRRVDQDLYLEKAKAVGLTALLHGVEKIYRATSSKGKYKVLLTKLQSFNLISISVDGSIEIKDVEYTARIIYLQPNNAEGSENVISFHEAAEIVEHENDAIGKRFAKSLREWAEVRAGEP